MANNPSQTSDSDSQGNFDEMNAKADEYIKKTQEDLKKANTACEEAEAYVNKFDAAFECGQGGDPSATETQPTSEAGTQTTNDTAIEAETETVA